METGNGEQLWVNINGIEALCCCWHPLLFGEMSNSLLICRCSCFNRCVKTCNRGRSFFSVGQPVLTDLIISFAMPIEMLLKIATQWTRPSSWLLMPVHARWRQCFVSLSPTPERRSRTTASGGFWGHVRGKTVARAVVKSSISTPYVAPVKRMRHRGVGHMQGAYKRQCCETGRGWMGVGGWPEASWGCWRECLFKKRIGSVIASCMRRAKPRDT